MIFGLAGLAAWKLGVFGALAAAGGKAAGECAGLEERLWRMMNSPDPQRFALEQDIYYQGGRVRVIIEFVAWQGQPVVADLPPGYGQVEARAGNTVQALVSLEKLCQLSNEASVRSVMAATRIAVP